MTSLLEHERVAKGVQGISIALVERGDVAWAAGFGNAADTIPATANTLYRVGSITKTLTSIAVLRLHDQGKLHIDSAVRVYLPDFRPEGHDSTEITVRHLLAHRSGMVRESPRGSYFDPRPTTVRDASRSVYHLPLVHPAGTRTKYSNAGYAVLGELVERVSGVKYARYVTDSVALPLGMATLTFREDRAQGGIASGRIWRRDGRQISAPPVDLGDRPAGGARSSVLDLARLASALMPARVEDSSLPLSAAARSLMTDPFIDADGDTVRGLGLVVGRLAGRELIGHGGNTYGFSCDMSILREDHLAAVVCLNLDNATGLAGRIAEAGLRSLLAVRNRESLPLPPLSRPVHDSILAVLPGRFRRGDRIEDFYRRDARIFRLSGGNSVARELRQLPTGRLIIDDPVLFGPEIVMLSHDSIRAGRDTLARDTFAGRDDVPTNLREYTGHYGFPESPVTVYAQDGGLYLLAEFIYAYPIGRITGDTFRFPDFGLYESESVSFLRNSSGRITSLKLGGVLMERQARPLVEVTDPLAR